MCNKIAFALLILSGTPLYAAKLECKLPKACVNVIGTHYYAGSSQEPVVYTEVTCRTLNGPTMYIYREISLKGVLAWQRIAMPSEISFVHSEQDKLTCTKQTD